MPAEVQLVQKTVKGLPHTELEAQLIEFFGGVSKIEISILFPL